MFTPKIEDSDSILLAQRQKIAFRLKPSDKLPNDLNKHSTLTTSSSGPTLSDLGLSIVHPFYNDKKRFKLQLSTWNGYSDDIKRSLSIVIADDCSSPPVSSFLTEDPKLNLSCFRAAKDLKWNTPGAINLGVLNAPTDWVLIMDSDCLLDANMITRLFRLSPSKLWFYYFKRKRITKDRKLARTTRYLPCAILFHRDSFKTIGGFDEDFTGERSGGYGVFDTHFEVLIGRYGFLRGILEDVIITEHMQDSVGDNIQKLTGVTRSHMQINLHLHSKKLAGKIPMNRRHLNFPWEKSFEYKIGD